MGGASATSAWWYMVYTMYSSVPPPGHVEEPTSATVPETSENKPRHVHDHQWKVNIVGSTARECIIYYTVTIQTIVMLVLWRYAQ